MRILFLLLFSLPFLAFAESAPNLNTVRIKREMKPFFGLYSEEISPGELDTLARISIRMSGNEEHLTFEVWDWINRKGHARVMLSVPLNDLWIKSRPDPENKEFIEYEISSASRKSQLIGFSLYRGEVLSLILIDDHKRSFATLIRIDQNKVPALVDPAVVKAEEKFRRSARKAGTISPAEFIMTAKNCGDLLS